VDEVAVMDSPIQGKGVFATRPFERGATVLLIDDSRVVDDAHPLDPSVGELERHCDWLGPLVVHMKEPELYINHACEPSTFIQTQGSQRSVVAYRDIAAGEEITYDYLVDADGGVVWGCSCGGPDCRGPHVHDFFTLPDDKLREYLPLLAPWFEAAHRTRLDELRGRLA
jgi:uncharacterized protein